MRSVRPIFILVLLAACRSFGQGHGDMHEMHPAPPPTMPATEMPHAQHAAGMEGMSMDTNPIGIPMSRFGSGTSWLPDSTPMYGVMQHRGEWNIMYHGAAFLAYDRMNGPRGDSKLISTNWAMAMASRKLDSKSDVRLAAMMSLEPLTVGGEGYPLLFQTGETWRRQPLRDHQHPHNLFIELSSYYTRAITADSAAFAYFAPVGEPAFGPVTYMHRTTGLDNLLAPIGHHWQDATHITFWTATLGYETRKWKLDASAFNGREPSENRYEWQSPKFDSFSGRVSYNPTPDLTLQASRAYLHSPEELHPGEDVHRTDVSATYNRPLGPGRNFQSTLVWARNRIEGQNLDGWLIEAQLKQDRGWTPFFRYEHVRKNAEELVLPESFPPDQVFDLQQLSLGVTREIFTTGSLNWAVGGQIVLNKVPCGLRSVYGDDPAGWLLFIRVHPNACNHQAPCGSLPY